MSAYPIRLKEELASGETNRYRAMFATFYRDEFGKRAVKITYDTFTKDFVSIDSARKSYYDKILICSTLSHYNEFRLIQTFNYLGATSVDWNFIMTERFAIWLQRLQNRGWKIL